MRKKTAIFASLLPILLSLTSLSPVYGQGLVETAAFAQQDAKKAPEATAPVVSGPISVIPFQEPAEMLTLSGEDDSVILTFSATPVQMAAGGVIQIGYQNAVSVLPDDSIMDVELNGKPIGSFPIRSPNGVGIEKIPVASADLKPGRNKLFVRARQIHRVDCSLEATYELWTKLDPQVSGFSSAVPTGFSSIEDLAGIGKTANARTDFRIVLPSAVTADELNDALPLVQIMALYLNRTDIQVTVANQPGTGPGIDFYIGSMQSGLTKEKSMEPLDAAPMGLTVRNGATPDRAVVLMKEATADTMRALLLKEARSSMNPGFKSGIFSTAYGKVLAESGKSFTLSETGYHTRPFAGRLAHTHFKMEMPADFYPGDYATIDMDLHAATSPGLDPNSQLLVRVNDKVVTSYPFRDQNGQQFNGKRVAMPLRAFHPGVNTVDILAELPKASDSTCAIDTRDDAKPRFLLLENTRITIPELARVARLPDLAALAGKAYPFRNGKPFKLFIEHPDTINLGAAFTLLTRLSLSSGNPMNAKFNLSAPVPSIEGDIMVMGTAKPSDQSEAPTDNSPEIPALDETKTSGIQETSEISSGSSDANVDDLLQAFTKSTADQDASGANWYSLGNMLSYSSGRFAKWLRYEDATQMPALPSSGSSLVTLAQLRAPSGMGTWTVVSAASSADLASGATRLTEGNVWNSLNGGSAVIRTADNGLQTVVANDRYVAEITDMSFGNNRRLAAAWLSDNFQTYVLLVLGFMGTVALWLGRYVPSKGVRTDQ